MARRGRQNMRAKSVLDAGRLKNRQAGRTAGAYFTQKSPDAGFRKHPGMQIKTRGGKV